MIKDEAEFMRLARELTILKQSKARLKEQESANISLREMNCLYEEQRVLDEQESNLQYELDEYDDRHNSNRKGGWYALYTGRRIWIQDPRPQDFDIVDIAHALGQCARFAGHLRQRYSVGQHSVMGSNHIHPDLAPFFLMHDASEFILQDIISSNKRFLKEIYEPLEEGMMLAIAKRFGFSMDDEACRVVKKVDRKMLLTEVRDLSTHGVMLDDVGEYPFDEVIHGAWDDKLSTKLFLQRFQYLFPKEPKRGLPQL